MKCIKLSHCNWKIVGFRYPGSGSQGIRQSGSLANRQSGTQAIRQSGSLAIRQSGSLAIRQTGSLGCEILKYFIFILFYIMPSVSIADATAHDSCTENCGKESPIISTSKASQEAVLESEKECPTNVQSIRRLMAFSYGSCEVLSSPTWRAKENNGVIVHGYTSQPNCNFRENGGKSCTQIDNYQEVMETHPYNKSEKIEACQNNMQCNINGNKTCPVLFAMAGESYAYKDRNNHNEIDVFKHKTKDNAGNTFLGWNCSEYVTTAMALAGRRLVKKNEGRCGDIPSENIGDSKQGYTAQIYVGLTQYSCSCLSSVDITNPNDTIKPGDLISLDGEHIMIVEAAGQPFFKDAKR